MRERFEDPYMIQGPDSEPEEQGDRQADTKEGDDGDESPNLGLYDVATETDNRHDSHPAGGSAPESSIESLTRMDWRGVKTPFLTTKK